MEDMPFNVTVVGNKELDNMIKRLGEILSDTQMNSFYEKMTLIGSDDLKELTPVDTGTTRKSWMPVVEKGLAEIVNISPVMVYLEYGTKFMEARNIVKEYTPKLGVKMLEEIERVLDKVLRE